MATDEKKRCWCGMELIKEINVGYLYCVTHRYDYEQPPENECCRKARQDERKRLTTPTPQGACRVCAEDDAVIQAYAEGKKAGREEAWKVATDRVESLETMLKAISETRSVSRIHTIAKKALEAKR